MKFLYLVGVIHLLSVSMLLSQPSTTGNWLIFSGNNSLNNKWHLQYDFQYRNFNLIGNTNQVLLRSGIAYQTSKTSSLLFGYAFVHHKKYTDTENKTQWNEHRLYQQLITKQHFSRLQITHRYRFEQRFQEAQSMQLRMRYALQFLLPISNSKLSPRTIYAASYNEIFINLQKPYFDQNRLYAALGIVAVKNLRFELGWMMQTFETTHRHLLQMAIINQFSFQKETKN